VDAEVDLEVQLSGGDRDGTSRSGTRVATSAMWSRGCTSCPPMVEIVGGRIGPGGEGLAEPGCAA
jgi:hypothetical protein